MNNQKKPQVRWHVSRETALALERLRKTQGYRSWDEFFINILNKETGLTLVDPNILESINQKLENIKSSVGDINKNLPVTFEETSGSLDPRIMTTLDRILMLLSLAIERDGPQVAVTETGEPKPMSKLRERLLKQGL